MSWGAITVGNNTEISQCDVGVDNVLPVKRLVVAHAEWQKTLGTIVEPLDDAPVKLGIRVSAQTVDAPDGESQVTSEVLGGEVKVVVHLVGLLHDADELDTFPEANEAGVGEPLIAAGVDQVVFHGEHHLTLDAVPPASSPEIRLTQGQGQGQDHTCQQESTHYMKYIKIKSFYIPSNYIPGAI